MIQFHCDLGRITIRPTIGEDQVSGVVEATRRHLVANPGDRGVELDAVALDPSFTGSIMVDGIPLRGWDA